jgi:nicotinamidase-related amidase
MRQEMIVGNPVLIVVDIQVGSGGTPEKPAIPIMAAESSTRPNARRLIAAAREAGVPVVFIQEVHRPDLTDFGRELDGEEEIHCLEDDPQTGIDPEIGYRPDDILIRKRRYSAFFGTELGIVLKGLKAETLILIGGLTDVCVHYTFVDAHQHDYYTRVVEDCVIGSTRAAHDASLNAMEYLQSGARRTTEEILAAFAARIAPATSSPALAGVS